MIGRGRGEAGRGAAGEWGEGDAAAALRTPGTVHF